MRSRAVRSLHTRERPLALSLAAADHDARAIGWISPRPDRIPADAITRRVAAIPLPPSRSPRTPTRHLRTRCKTHARPPSPAQLSPRIACRHRAAISRSERVSRAVDLINATEPPAALNPPELSANWPNLRSGNTDRDYAFFQGFSGTGLVMQYRLPCRRSRVRVPSAAPCDESGHRSHLSRDIGLTFEGSASGRALAFGCASRSWPGR